MNRSHKLQKGVEYIHRLKEWDAQGTHTFPLNGSCQKKGLMMHYNVYTCISNQIDLRKLNNFFFNFPLLISRKIKDYCYELLSVSCQLYKTSTTVKYSGSLLVQTGV